MKSISLPLPYEPPFEWSAVLAFFRHRTIDSIEHTNDDAYVR
jgi:AraC family transcriptional regulator, regulatory protein of adaptative response / DNA-3-methyladenine glycosylase II